MADFRKWIYALAAVPLLAGLTIPASAQGLVTCNIASGVSTLVRAEGMAELVGDLVLDCSGGTPTPPTAVVPQVNFTVFLNTNVTSRLLAPPSSFDEALLIVDDPHTAANANNILNCGAAGEDTTVSGPGVCTITSDGNPADTYNGTEGHPNVFQGRAGSPLNPNQFNSVSFLGVPFDPPGTTTTRRLRFTNIRADANHLGVSSSFLTNTITEQVSVTGTTLGINGNQQQIVAYVLPGLVTNVSHTNFSFLQCNAENSTAFTNGSGSGLTNNGGNPAFTFTEGFASSWKPKNISYVLANGTLTGGNYSYADDGAHFNHPADLNQNVPGVFNYNTETGFENQAGLDPTPNNPPTGIGTGPTAATGNPFASTTGTGIARAGIADQGTRLALQLTNIPQGAIVLAPQVVYLKNSTTASSHTGVMVLTSTDANGAGALTPPTLGTNPDTSYVQVQSSGLVVYEVLFADPSSVEFATVNLAVAYAANLSQNLPQPGVTAQAAGSFAPFYSTATAHNPSSTLPQPRFVPGLTPVNLFSINKCACNMLFPYVVSAANYDTGIAIANTSQDNLGVLGGSAALPQAGAVQFWYYGTGANNAAPPATQCTNTTSPGTCPGTTTVPAGQVLTYVLSSGSTQWGLDNRGAGFVGYVIAQAQFQYCHAFAFIGALGNGPYSPGISQGYLGLILDNTGINCADGTIGLCRTPQRAENLVQ